MSELISDLDGSGLRSLQEPVDARHGILLYLEEVTVSFDGFKAIDNLSLYVGDGELRCIIGPNGAGKTTMMDIITGKTKPDSGRVFFGQTIDLLKLDEPAIARVGIGRKFQRPTVIEPLTVLENLELAMSGAKRLRGLMTTRLSGEERDRIAAAKSATASPPCWSGSAWASRRNVKPESWRTARNSGWKSACC
ncbi:MAG: urea transporter, ATP-binding protein UrtD [Proteobacteria bacterium]|nr:urea transporter, ATP-binding protein UrtD [Pseudomonadota bacterium]